MTRALASTLLVIVAIAGVFGAACGLGGCAAATRAALYHPSGGRVAPETAGLVEAREAVITADDGVELVTWRIDPPPAGATILYFHGNASNLANRSRFFRTFSENGFGMAALSYRSFSGSGGRPSEDAIIQDALTFYDTLIAEGADPERLVAYGESLGSGVAVQLAAKRDLAGLVLHAPYDAIEDVAAGKLPFLAPKLIMTDEYRSVDVIGEVTEPVLWLHGDADRVIPLRHGQRLFDAAQSDKVKRIIAGAGHFDLYAPGLFVGTTAPFIREVTGTQTAQNAVGEEGL